MFSQADFLQFTQWSGIATIGFALLALLAFILKWGIRFRLVGTSGFMLVLTAGLFALSLAPLTRTVIPGALRYSLVYDNGATKAVITTSVEITPSELEATLQQAASDLFSYGRLASRDEDKLTIRARTVIHPEEGLSVPLYLGQVKRSLASREDSQMEIEIYQESFDQLAKLAA